MVNDKLQAPRSYRREVRQSVYFINKYGLDSHIQHTQNDRANHLKHLLGKINHILFINPKDDEARQAYESLRRLMNADSAENAPTSE